jgi:hypothetical protein
MLKLCRLTLLTLGLAVSNIAIAGANTPETSEQTIVRYERILADAVISKDTSALEPIIAPDFYAFNPTTGGRSTRNDLFSGIKQKRFAVVSMNFRPYFVRVFGSTAIAQGSNTTIVHYKGKTYHLLESWFDVFGKRNGNWTWLVSSSPEVNDKITDKVVCKKPFCSLNEPPFSVGR